MGVVIFNTFSPKLTLLNYHIIRDSQHSSHKNVHIRKNDLSHNEIKLSVVFVIKKPKTCLSNYKHEMLVIGPI